ncbi:MAG: pyrimidine utilization protein D [Pseudomonadota bacterium]
MRISGEAHGLFYEEHGPSEGIPLILSPGLGGSGHYWAYNLDGLTGRSHGPYRVITYDHRGTGNSDRALPDVVTIEAMARDILMVMDALDLSTTNLIGHALGGLAGLALALVAPERLDRLVVVNGWVHLHPWTRRCFEARLALLRDSGPRAYVRAQPLFLYPPFWLDGGHDEELAAQEHAALATFPGIDTVEKRIAALTRFNIAARLGEIATPVLCMGAFDDMLVPWSETVQLASRLPNATQVIMDYGAHAVNVVDPDGFEEKVLAWLGGEPMTEE